LLVFGFPLESSSLSHTALLFDKIQRKDASKVMRKDFVLHVSHVTFSDPSLYPMHSLIEVDNNKVSRNAMRGREEFNPIFSILSWFL